MFISVSLSISAPSIVSKHNPNSKEKFDSVSSVPLKLLFLIHYFNTHTQIQMCFVTNLQLCVFIHFSLILCFEINAQIRMCFVTNVQHHHFPTMTQNANQADGNRIMSSKLMDVIVYPLTNVATMNAKL